VPGIHGRWQGACRDPTDDKFLELAVNGRADLIPRKSHRPAGG
jgi:predicted nucleic acid-binding protein